MHGLRHPFVRVAWAFARALGRVSPFALVMALVMAQEGNDPRRLAGFAAAGPLMALDLAWTALAAYRGTNAAQTGH